MGLFFIWGQTPFCLHSINSQNPKCSLWPLFPGGQLLKEGVDGPLAVETLAPHPLAGVFTMSAGFAPHKSEVQRSSGLEATKRTVAEVTHFFDNFWMFVADFLWLQWQSTVKCEATFLVAVLELGSPVPLRFPAKLAPLPAITPSPFSPFWYASIVSFRSTASRVSPLHFGFAWWFFAIKCSGVCK